MYFACFSCARRIARMMKSRIPKATSGHLDRSFFLKCPEVGLGIPKATSGYLDRLFFLEVSRGRFRNS